MKQKLQKIATSALLLIAFLVFGKVAFAQAPTITSFSPTSGSIGTLVTIIGTNLNNLDTIKIGGVSAIKISAKTDTLVAMVMPGAVTGSIFLKNTSGNVTSGSVFTNIASKIPSVQQGNKLIGSDGVGQANQGISVSISADGNTAIVGANYDNSNKGAVWIYTRNGTIWTQQGNKLVGTGSIGTTINQGCSVSLSADGNTILIGGTGDNSFKGAAWVFTRNAGVWTQQGNKLVGTGSIGTARQGTSVSLSADGNTAIVGGYGDNNNEGAAWIFTRTAGVWTQQGNKLVGTGNIGAAMQGFSVSISAEGNTAIIGGRDDNSSIGAVWIYTRTAGAWTQQGNKLVGTGSIGTNIFQGWSVSLSADGNTAMVGGYGDNSYQGAAWIYTRNSGIWSQQGNKLVVTGNVIGPARQGKSVCLSADGNTAVVGGSNDDNGLGAVWVFKRSAGTWSQYGNKLKGNGNISSANQGSAVSISADGNTILSGGINDDNSNGATWVFNGVLSLQSVLFSSGSLVPAFLPDTFNYTSTTTASTITVTPTIAYTGGAIFVRINGGNYFNVISGSQSTGLPLNLGSNIMEILVTTQNGTITKTYTITVTRMVQVYSTITSFNPISDTIGAIVTINGTNFNPNALNNIVYFGPVKANVISASSNMLTVNVPSGATYSPITVTNTALTQIATSVLSFTPAQKPYNDSILASGFTYNNIAFSDKYFAIGDLNSDGKPDIVNTSTNSSFGIMKNTSSGSNITFLPQIINYFNFTTSGGFPNRITLKDLDGDGKLDMIASQGWQEIVIKRNISTIDSFKFESQISLNTNYLHALGELVVQDLDGDAKSEIAYINKTNTICIFKNIGSNGVISFDPTTFNIPYTDTSTILSAGDLDGDGKLDLILTNTGDSIVSIFKNNSAIGNLNFSNNINFSVGRSPASIVTGDINGDGKVDIIVTSNFYGNSFSVLKNTSVGSVISFAPKIDILSDSLPRNIRIGDINGDGKPDLTTFNYFLYPSYHAYINIFRNTSTINNISFSNITKLQIGTNNNEVFSNIWDLNGDAKPEIVFAYESPSYLGYFQNNPIILSTNANLSNITLSNGNLSPSFNKDSLSYKTIVNYLVDSISITPFKADSFASIQIKTNNGSYSNIISGVSSNSIPLLFGLNNISIKVTAQNGTTIKIYTLSIYRFSVNAKLSNINLIGTPYLPTFHTDTLTYAANVLFGINNIKVSSILADTSARIKIKMNNGVFTNINNKDTSGLLPLNVGLNTIAIKVTAQDTNVTRTYLINITRAAAIPPSAMSYASPTIIATRTITNINNSVSYSGDSITGFSITPALPTGVSLNTLTGRISGLPTIAFPQTVFTITGTNSSGSTTANFTLTVNKVAPTKLKYIDSIVLATRTTTNINSSVTYLGDSIANFSISPALPTGLSLNTITGLISGIPTVILTKTTFTITGTNNGGSTSASYTLTINNLPPNKLKYSDSIVIATRTVTNINSSVTYSGDSITSFSITPSLPNGVTLNTLTGLISGIPTVAIPQTKFTITGTNNGGSTTASFTLTVNKIAPTNLKYSDSIVLATRTITNINSSVTYSGDSITSFSITPSLPNGVTLNTLTGLISGIPTVAIPQTKFTITGTNNGGSTTASFTLTVNKIAPSNLKYKDSIVIATRTITNINSSVSYSGDSITSFSITPTLPNGVTLNTSTGLISGIPTVVLPQTTFTITGTNNGGGTTASFTLTVNKIAPVNLKYKDSIVIATRTITNINSSVTYSGDSIDSFSITPSLPNGITLNTSTGLISGFPTVTLSQTTFTITGTNNGGSTTASLTLTVNKIAPSNLKYKDSIVIATRTITNINSSVTYSGDSITSFSISPSLPNGVILNTLTGLISGIPTVNIPQTVFTITGSNNGGSTTASFTLTVNSPVSIKSINIETFSNINIKPNPFNSQIEIDFMSNTKEITQLIILDAVGKEVFSKNLESNIGNNTFTIDELTYLKEGIYFVRLANINGYNKTFKLVKE